MKKILFIWVAILYIACVPSKAQISYPDSKDYYLNKSKSQKTIAWILVGGGIAMTTNTAADISGFIVLAGIISDIASIPFFISSSKNKKRAVALAVNNENILLTRQHTIVLKPQPTLTLKIGL